MNQFKKLALSAAALYVALGASAWTKTNEEHFFCSFENQSDFNGWTSEDLNGKTENDQNFWDYDFNNKAAFVKHGGQDCDDWLFSPKTSFSAGKEYVVKVKFRALYDSRMQVTFGTDATVASQTTVSDMALYKHGYHYAAFKMPALPADGEYCFGIHCGTKPTDGGWLYIYSVEVVEDNDGSIAMTLINAKTQQPIAGANLSLSGSYYVANNQTTDDNGCTTFANLTPGNYTLNYDLDGYIPETLKFTVGAKEDLVKEIAATPMVEVNVSGAVVDQKGAPMEGVKVALTGVVNYEFTTGADGKFMIPGVRGEEEYALAITKDYHLSHTTTLTTDKTDIDLGTIVLEKYFGQPRGISADPTGAGMFVSWMAPVCDKEFYYDNGFEGCHKLQGYTVTYVRYGVKFAEPMIVNELKWLAAYVNDGKVDVAVYPLDAEGNIATTPAFEAKDVPCETYNWQNDLNWQYYRLPEALEAPYGCLVSIGHEAMQNPIQICFDYKNNGGPSYTSYNDLSEGWEKCRVSNFLIRVNGVMLSRDVTFDAKNAAGIRAVSTPVRAGAPVKLEGVSYNVWRIAGDDLENKDAWTPVGSDIRGLYAIDSQFDKLPQGLYHYAVQAVNDYGKTSATTYSAPVEHKLKTDVRVYVYTNSAVDFSCGALVTLNPAEDPSKTYTATTGADGIAAFGMLPKGTYSLRVEKHGFETAVYDNVGYTTDAAYLSQIPLSLTPLAPFSLEAVQSEDSQDVALTWNTPSGIFEDFEGMEDFAVNPAGDLGWSYADVDGDKTFGVGECEDTPYPNMFSPMAFMAFNPSATTPDVTMYIQPYSGKKVLISAGLEHGGRNDDYLFSPELDVDAPKTLSFQAASAFYGSMGNEEFMVGYTTAEAKPENVVWLTEKAVSVPGMWTSFTYTLPAAAKHAVIRCVSNQCMFFMLDDIFIGSGEADIFAMTTFNVYLDEELMGTTSSRSFAFENLDEGKHIVKIQTVYPMADYSNLYSEFTELIFNVKKIEEEPIVGIEEVAAGSDAKPEYYTLDGLRVENPELPGVYIRLLDGKATKVLVK